MKFQLLTESDLLSLRKYFGQDYGLCDYTFGANYLWFDFYKCTYAITQNDMLIIADNDERNPSYSFPIGSNDPMTAIEELIECCKARGRQLVMGRIPEEMSQVVLAHFPGSQVVQMDYGWDYIYLIDELSELVGKKFGGIRNHINKFMTICPNTQYKTIEQSDMGRIKEFLAEYKSDYNKDAESYWYELDATNRVLDNYDNLGQVGGMILCGEKVLAFAIGEITNETLFVHIEKSSKQVPSVSKLLVREFARAHRNLVKYVNRGEDMNDVGLRFSKEQYNPCKLGFKFKATFA